MWIQRRGGWGQQLMHNNSLIEVQAPPGTVVGFVKQEGCGLLNPWFKILNADGETILRIKGPFLGCSCYADSNFYV